MNVKTTLLAGAILVAATLFAYLPAMRAGFVWDDPDHTLHNPTLRDARGLLQMWTDRHALPQWYPLVHTTFWIEYQLWGERPFGYHLINILLHAASAIVLWRLLRRLDVTGAWLAAAVFALHPVHVESVAWVTERKNVLSLLFYLLALSTYLRAIDFPRLDAAVEGSPRGAAPDPRPANVDFRWTWYIVALALFLGALFSKTVTASLPAAILLIIWWKTNRIRVRDVLPLLPLFILGIALAIGTAQLEQARVGAIGHEWRYADTPLGDFLARCIIAGRALWFYAWKLIWPANLAFIYERWTIDWRQPLQHLWPISFIVVVVALLALRRRIGRGPLVAMLFFAGTLFPALGFFNVFPHRYAFVADHFQYHASIGLIALAAALLARAMQRAPFVLRAILVALLLFPLAVLTHAQARIYRDPITLWDDTVRQSPRNWMPWTNLANALAAQKRYDEAIPIYLHALSLAPHVDDVQYNAGVARARQKRWRDAERHFLRTVEIKPTYVPAWEALGELYADELNDPREAVSAYTRALEIAPHRTATRQKLLQTLLKLDPQNEQATQMLQQMNSRRNDRD